MALTMAVRTLLFLGLIFTSFGIMLAFIFLQGWSLFMHSLAWGCLAIRLPAVLVLMGIAGFVTVIVQGVAGYRHCLDWYLPFSTSHWFSRSLIQ
jgi:hypothetical protein